MNISQAKEIPLYRVVEALGGKHSHTARNGDRYYFSLFRPQERTASFVVYNKTNNWHDYGLAGNQHRNGGDIIDLWCDLHNLDRKAGLKEALEALQAYSNVPASGYPQRVITAPYEARQPLSDHPDEPRFYIEKLHDKIFFSEILAEIRRRRISLPVANLYLKQVYLKDTEKPERHMNGLAFPNMKGGYEISIPNAATGKSFKTSTRPKAPSFIMGKDASRIEIFEGFWDFLSRLEMDKLLIPEYNSYVLNSVSFASVILERIAEFKNNVQSVMLYLDNDEAGLQTTHFLTKGLQELNLFIGTKEHSYECCKDLNEWWIKCKTLNLQAKNS